MKAKGNSRSRSCCLLPIHFQLCCRLSFIRMTIAYFLIFLFSSAYDEAHLNPRKPGLTNKKKRLAKKGNEERGINLSCRSVILSFKEWESV